jgi:ABC-type transport system involved in cytochrome bd biosynthesis fused ATPase/permease subunit
VAGEALSAMAVVKAFGSERLEADRVRAGSEQRMAVGVDIARLQAGFDGIVGSVRAIGTALVIVVGVMRVAAGALSPGELLVFVSYTRKAYNPLKSLARESTKVAATMAKADRIAEILAADDVLEDGSVRGGRASGDVAVEHVSFAYDADRRVLDDVSLQVPAGGSVALVGPSGVGKSTLGALVARFHDPTEGRVLIDGRDAREYALDWLRAQWRSCSRTPCCSPAACATTSPTAPMRATTRSSPPRAPPPPTTSSASCRPATTPSSVLRARACPAASGSASASPARCCATRRSCSSTSRPRDSTPPAKRSCSTGCGR